MKKTMLKFSAAMVCLSMFSSFASAADFATEDQIKNIALTRTEPIPEDTFSIDDKELILLDSKEVSGETQYLVLENDIATYMRFSIAQHSSNNAWYNGWHKFRPEDTGSIAWWLNNTESGYITNMPKQNGTDMADYIVATDWDTEKVWVGSSNEEDSAGAWGEPYTVNAKIVVPSASEVVAYQDKINKKDSVWWTRTAFAEWGGGYPRTLVAIKADGKRTASEGGNDVGVRPMYWISEDFFGNMAINVSTAGDNILNILKTNFTEEELLNIYSQTQVDLIFGKEVVKPDITSVSISGTGDTTTDMTASAVLGENAASCTYTWQVSSTSSTEGFQDVGVGETITVTNDMASTTVLNVGEVSQTRWVRVGATPVSSDGILGDIVYSEAKQMPKALGPRTVREAVTQIPYVENTPDTNVFSVDGKRFILLDVSNDEFFVMADNCYGQVPFDKEGTQKYEPEDENNIGYYVENTVLGSGENALPESVKENAIEKVWRTAAASGNGNAPQDYIFYSKATLLGLDEYEKYADKIGANCEGIRWILRTADGTFSGDDAAKKRMMTMNGSANSSGFVKIEAYNSDDTNGFGVRPVMYLNKSFFLDAKVPVEQLGENVMKAMREVYTRDELLTVYSQDDTNIILGEVVIEKPEVLSVELIGSGDTTTQMSVSAQLSENTASCEYTWQVSSISATSGFTNVGTGETITVTNAMASTTILDVGEVSKTRWMRVGVTPISSDGVKGETIYSEAKQMPKALGPRTVRAAVTYIPYQLNTPDTNVFTVSGKRFILLDNIDGEFFVLADNCYGTTPFDTDNTQKYDPTDPNNIGYYVENTLLGVTNSALPVKIREHAVEKRWRTAAAAGNGNAPEDYAFNSKATLLGLDEYEKYADKIGAYCEGKRWILRTADGTFSSDDASKIRMMTITGETANSSGGVQIDAWSANSSYGVRPVLYLDRNFFLDAKIPAAELGENVRTVMKEIYTKDELSTVYTSSELMSYFGISDYDITSAEIASGTDTEKNINVRITSASGENGKVTVIAAVYDSEFKTLKGVTVSETEISAGSYIDSTLTVNVTGGIQGDKIKVMLFDNLANITPLCMPKTIE